MDLKKISGGKRLLFLSSDLRVVERQMEGRKFDPGLILGAANRCRFGCPRVVVCSPVSKGNKNTPFPTSFWLTCPWLARLAGAAESEGGVGELQRWLEDHARDKWPFFDMAHRLARMALLPPARLVFLRRFKPRFFDRLRRDGLGGTRYDANSPIRVKCIHLQTASWLALARHPGEDWLKSRGLGGDCGGASPSCL